MVQLRITPLYCVAFYFLIMLHGSMHELVHHFTAFAVCGEWGTKSFNSFRAACSTQPWIWLSTYAGPVYSYAMMWLGGYWLMRGAAPLTRQLGFATIFAQLPLQRITGPILSWNDEWFATRHLFEPSEPLRWGLFLLVVAIAAPPLVRAYFAIQNKGRILWFAFYFCFLPLILFAPALIGLEYLMVTRGVLNQQIIGIGLLFIINEVVTIVGFALTQRYLDPDRERAPKGAAREAAG
jgi:hypothetical protein